MSNNATLRISIAQLNLLVGDIEGNSKKIIETAIKARDEQKADLVVFSELALTAYPPEDLLLRPVLYKRIDQELTSIKKQVQGIALILGLPALEENNRHNRAILIQNGEVIAQYDKQNLPNYTVFDEKRYFIPGTQPCIVTFKNIKIAITICEDLWVDRTIDQIASQAVNLIIGINASPFDINKEALRKQVIGRQARRADAAIVYANQVGGQDELVFDGGSFVFDAKGRLCQEAKLFTEDLITVEIKTTRPIQIKKHPSLKPLSTIERIYKALTLGVHDYVLKNGFSKVVIGLSGGVDSALTLAIAADALGVENVECLMMPSRFTSEISLTDAKQQANKLNVKYEIMTIESIFQTFKVALAERFKGFSEDVTEENIQARIRGSLLMAISNKTGAMVLATGNKSEMAVGYATLYGDLVGGFCVLKNVPKSLVYELANYRNAVSPVIPERVITRPPSAELAQNQKDEDTLPPYPILDAILEYYIEKDESTNDIIKRGFDPKIVNEICNRVDQNEYKRRQTAPGVRITERAFGRDRRYPITSGFGRYRKKD